MKRRIYIGTSGWSYNHWKKVFYPAGVKTADWLEYYARFFNAAEINNSFYRLPTPETLMNWMQKVPRNFVFCPKMSRFLTHMKKLKDPEEPLERFFGVFEPMKPILGPVLIQLPAVLKFAYDRAEYLYRLLKTSYGKYSFAIEVRNESWLTDESLTLMAKYEVALVMSHSGGFFPYSEVVTAENVYVRFHGPEAMCTSSYSDEMLKHFARKFKKLEKEGHRIWAFFNNDIHGFAVTDAQRLIRFVEK